MLVNQKPTGPTKSDLRARIGHLEKQCEKLTELVVCLVRPGSTTVIGDDERAAALSHFAGRIDVSHNDEGAVTSVIVYRKQPEKKPWKDQVQ